MLSLRVNPIFFFVSRNSVIFFWNSIDKSPYPGLNLGRKNSESSSVKLILSQKASIAAEPTQSETIPLRGEITEFFAIILWLSLPAVAAKIYALSQKSQKEQEKYK